MTINEYVLLKDLTTFRTGGSARFFACAKTTDDLREAVGFAKEKSLPVFVLGGGSNLLISDDGFPGLVIKIELMGIEKRDGEGGIVEVIAGAGEDWDGFVGYCVEQRLYGVENLSLIPGTVGAAPVQNIGAYGTEAKDVISWVEVFDGETGELKKITNQECGFKYRDSIFKKQEYKKYIVNRVAFSLNKNGVLNTGYKDIKEYVVKNSVTDLSLQKLREIVIDIRTKKLPDPKKLGTAGSFFKNPVIQKVEYEKLLGVFPELQGFAYSDTQVKVPAAYLIDKICGFKGTREGDVGTYENQALAIVNYGSATAEDIKKFAQKISDVVRERTGIALEREVEYV